jgi:hypothetical protein
MRIDQSPTNRAYLRFQLAGIDLSKVTKAELRVYVTESSDRGYRVRRVNNTSWGETTIRYSNAPIVGDEVARSSTALSGRWITVNITSYVKGTGTREKLSMALVGGSDNGLTIASRESGSRAPRLIITMSR